MELSEAQVAQFKGDGYLILPDALSQDTVSALMDETHKMLEEFPLSSHPMTRFSTGEGKDEKHVGDEYFLTSGDKIRFFFEEDAFDSSGNLTKPKHRAINKIGHGLHDLSPQFRESTVSRTNAGIAKSLGFKDPKVLQSMIICKQPEIGGRVPPHQDNTFLYTNPPSAVGFWYALEDATQKNGCLSFAKGSHKRSPVRKRFVKTKNGGTGFEDVNEGQWPDDGLSYDKEAGEEEEQYTIGEVKAGTLVLIHGNIMHKSEKNTSDKSRFIYTFHVIEGEHEYDKKNWLQPSEAGFSKLLT